MITTILSDFSRVLLFAKDDAYTGSLNDLHKECIKRHGEDYDFFAYFRTNDELLSVLKNCNSQYSLYLFTTGMIQQKKEIRDILDTVVSDIYIAKEHNLQKNKASAYEFIIHKLQKMPQTLLYIDDQQENVDAAKSAGMSAIQYKDNVQIISHLTELLNL